MRPLVSLGVLWVCYLHLCCDDVCFVHLPHFFPPPRMRWRDWRKPRTALQWPWSTPVLDEMPVAERLKGKKTTRLTQIFTDKCSVGLRWSIHYRITWPKQPRKQDIILAFLLKNKTFHSQLRIWILLTDCYAFLSRSLMRTWYDHAISPAWINLVIEWIG